MPVYSTDLADLRNDTAALKKEIKEMMSSRKHVIAVSKAEIKQFEKDMQGDS